MRSAFFALQLIRLDIAAVTERFTLPGCTGLRTVFPRSELHRWLDVANLGFDVGRAV
jgi:hypothetical protein